MVPVTRTVSMHIRMPKPTKAEFIMMFLNQWDPVRGADKDYKVYQADAEEIAQQIRKNSTPESVEKVVSKVIKFRMELEKVDEPFDEEACKRYSGWILSAIKNEDKKGARGSLSQYAAPELREKEKGAWERAMVEKHGKKGGPCHYKAE